MHLRGSAGVRVIDAVLLSEARAGHQRLHTANDALLTGAACPASCPALVRRMSDVTQRTYYVDDLPGVLARDFLPFWPETFCFLIHYVVHTYVSC